MSKPTVHFVGTESEVAHHAAPLDGKVEYRITPADSIVDLAAPGDVAIFYSEHFDRFRDACDQLKKRNVATLYMLDGILEWRNAWEDAVDGEACPFTMRPVLSHKVACIGMSQKRILDSWGNEQKTEVVGVPRFDRLPRPPKEQAEQRGSETFRVLVATAKTPAFTADQAIRVEQSLRDLKEFFDAGSTEHGRRTQVVWRLTAQLAAKLDVENSLDDLTGAGLAAQLSEVDAVISTASTSMLEAMFFDLPVALLDYHNTPAYVRTAWRIGSVEHIQPTVAELMRRPERKMLFQRTELFDATYCRADAAERLATLIRTMQEAALKHVEVGQALSFPPNMLSEVDPVSSSDVRFDQAEIFSDFGEFELNDTPELQSQLAHSRREIEQLKNRLTIRESELAHAHKIFDSINGHPIIGRFVKLGRWWQGLGTRNEDKDLNQS